MRLNRNTIILLLVSLVVIIAVVVIGNNRANQPAAASPTPTGGGPLLEDVVATDVLSLAVRNNQTGDFTRLTRADSESDWDVIGPDESDAADAQVVDQTAATETINTLISLAYDSSFEAENLADFGLAEPAYTIEVDTGGDQLHVILVGNRNPAGNRYYVISRAIDAAQAEATEEAAPTTGQVLLVNQGTLDSLIEMVAQPPYQPTAMPTATPTATLNPMSEVEIATATAEAQATINAVIATIEAEDAATAEVTAEMTAEATPEVTVEATAEATDEAE